jgi:hypothetical protein
MSLLFMASPVFLFLTSTHVFVSLSNIHIAARWVPGTENIETPELGLDTRD